MLASEYLKTNLEIYAHCKQIPQEKGPRIQLFTTDIILGKLAREGFYRSVIYTTEGLPDHRRITDSLRELKRYLNGQVLQLTGFHTQTS